MTLEIDKLKTVGHAAANAVLAFDCGVFDYKAVEWLRTSVHALQKVDPQFRKYPDVPKNPSD